MEKNEQDKLAFKFAMETTKQLMALATAIIALTVTFSKDFLTNMDGCSKTLAILGWVFFGISILCGQLTLHGLTGTLTLENPSIKKNTVNNPSFFQMVFFFLGIGVLVSFAIVSL